MTNSYNQAALAARLRNIGLAVVLTGASALTAQAQLGYTVANSVNNTGTYTDLGTTGTVITTANTDDANSAATPIGFPFSYNGTVFNDFVLNTNGFIKLGATAPTGAAYTDGGQSIDNGPITGTENNLLLPFNQDLTAGTAGGTEYRVVTTGATPNRITTIQWKNVSDKARGTTGRQYANFSFQVKLYETTNTIQFVYGTATPGAAADENPKFVTVGIKGSGSTTGQVVLANKASMTPWAGSVFLDAQYTGNAHNVRSSVLPDPGRTYTFAIPVANDVATQVIYGYDRLVVPSGSPAVIRALVRNAGTTAVANFTVSLNITGANTLPGGPLTQTVNSLAIGATEVVTFPAVGLSATGNNTVTVTTSLTNDGNATNDGRSMNMETNATTSSYDTPNLGSAGVVFAGGVDVYYGAKFTLSAPRDIIGVKTYIGEAGASATSKTSVGETVYGVVIDATTGALLARSANYVITTADVGAAHTFNMTSPATVQAGDVIVGMARGAATSTINFYPYMVQTEDPTRPNTFYAGSTVTPAAPSLLFTGANNTYKLPYDMITAAPATCPTPTGITFTALPTSATFTFTGPSNATGYELVYGQTGFNPTTGGTTSPAFTTSPYTLSGLTGSTCYDVYIRAVCSATDRSTLAGPIAVCTPCTPPIITTYPYTQDFNTISTGQSLPCGITVNDTNNDANTWEPLATVPTQNNPALPIGNGGSGNAMVYFYNADGVTAANDWFFSPAMLMTAGRAYRVSFSLRSSGATYPEGLEVKYGAAATPAGQTTTIYTNTAIINPAYAAATGVTDITPNTTGTYYIGFHATSGANNFFLAVDDLTVTQVLASSAALTRALTVYPNPSASGQFNLEVRGANAAQGLNVEVTNMLGQTVYTGKAKDNFTNSLNLTSLASGIYTLKVKNGNEYSVQQISIVK